MKNSALLRVFIIARGLPFYCACHRRQFERSFHSTLRWTMVHPRSLKNSNLCTIICVFRFFFFFFHGFSFLRASWVNYLDCSNTSRVYIGVGTPGFFVDSWRRTIYTCILEQNLFCFRTYESDVHRPEMWIIRMEIRDVIVNSQQNASGTFLGASEYFNLLATERHCWWLSHMSFFWMVRHWSCHLFHGIHCHAVMSHCHTLEILYETRFI